MKSNIVHTLTIDIDELKNILRIWALNQGIEAEQIELKLKDTDVTGVTISGKRKKQSYSPANVMDVGSCRPYN